MIDKNLLKINPEIIFENLKNRNNNLDLNKIIEMDEEFRNLTTQIQIQQKKKNELTNSKENKDLVVEINRNIEKIENNLKKFEDELKFNLALIPNILDKSVPFGYSSEENVEIKKYKEIIEKKHKHYDYKSIKSPSIMSGSRFVDLVGPVSTLERAIGQFCLDFLVGKGFIECSLPTLLKSESLYKTGHLPKDEENMFKVQDDFFLIPTSEVSLANLSYNKVFNENELPLKLTTLSSCFRREAGAAGRDTKGLIRLHQFQKCEMFVFATKENSFEIHEEMRKNTEAVLEMLELPYRTILLCSGDTGFCSAKTYDVEVLMAGEKEYREIASISNCTDFQTRRLNTKLNRNGNKELIHSLNGSCLPLGRTLAAIIEYYGDGNKIKIPPVLQKYTGFSEIEI